MRGSQARRGESARHMPLAGTGEVSHAGHAERRRWLRRVPLPLAVFLVGAAVFLWRCWHYYPFLADDALISLRYTRHLLEGKGLVWNPGERVEGYSNLLWILVLATAAKVGADLIVAARVLGVLSMLATLAAVVFAQRPRDGRHALLATGALLLLVFSAPLAVWAVAGLETAFAAALMTWAFVVAHPLLEGRPSPARALAAGTLLGLLCLTRTDGVILSGAAGLGLLVAREWGAGGVGATGTASGAGDVGGAGPSASAPGRERSRMMPHADTVRAVVLLALPVALLVGAQLAFRLWYYGEWVPNPALAKVAFTPFRLLVGLRYVGVGAMWALPLVAATLAVVVASLRTGLHRRRVVFSFVALVVWNAYVVLLGGDFFPAHRHLVPSVLLCGFILAEGAAFADRVDWRRLRAVAGSDERTAASPPVQRTGTASHSVQRTGTATPLVQATGRATPRAHDTRLLPAVLTVLIAGLGVLQAFDPDNQNAEQERLVFNAQVTATVVKRAFHDEQPLWAAGLAGAYPYFSEVRALDTLGINDRFLAKNPPPDFGSGRPGHELGNASYVLARRPDLVTICGGIGCWNYEVELVRHPEFLRHYRHVDFLGRHPFDHKAGLWVRLDGLLGIEGTMGDDGDVQSISIPGYLLSGNPRSFAYFDGPREGPGNLGIDATARTPAWIDNITVPAGTWRIEVDASDEVHVEIVPDGSSTPFAVSQAVVLPFDTTLTVRLTAPAQTRAHVVEVVLWRLA